MTTAAAKIAEGLRDAIAGNIDRVEIDGQVWVRRDKEIKRLRISELAWKLVAKHKKEWAELPQSEKEAAFDKALESTTEDLVRSEEENDRLRAALQPFAEYAKRIDENSASKGYADGCPLGLIPEVFFETRVVCMGHCREARRVLEGPAESSG